MTEFEMQQHRKQYEQQAQASLWRRVVSRVRRLFRPSSSQEARRQRLEKKAEIERKARQAL